MADSTSSVSSSAGGSGDLLRLVGLASGLDVDAMVSKLMAAERMPLNRLVQKKQTLEWQRDDYRSMNTQLTDYRTNKLVNYRLEKTFKIMKADITGNTDAVSASASSNAAKGSIRIKVNNLATAASKWSSGDIRKASAMPPFDPSIALGSQQNKLDAGTLSKSVYKISINGAQVTINRDTDSLNDVINNINKNTNVSAFYDAQTGRVSFVSKETGQTNGLNQTQSYITFEDDGNFLQNVLKINVSSNTSSDSIQAKNASVEINGLSTTRTSNTFNVNGVDITLLKEGGSEATITTSTDTDAIVDSIKNFINDYNSTLDTIYNKANEPKYRDFPPLTDDQRKNMSDNEIKLWEDKAKSGMLKNDPILTQAYNNLRLDMSAQVKTGSSKYNTLSSIGIETGDYSEHGKLYLTDETKLRAAIEENPEAVTALFTASGDGNDRSTMGIAERMYNDLKGTVDSLTEKAGNSFYINDTSLIGKDIKGVSDQIDEENSHLKDVESRYYNQFTALETAMNQFNSQSAYLANAFGGSK